MYLLRSLLIALTLSLCAYSQAQTIAGRCVGVTDGDTIRVLAPGNVLHKVRLQGIDSPEGKQPYGQRSKQVMSDLVFGKDVVLQVTGTDRYQRTLADSALGMEKKEMRGLSWLVFNKILFM